MSQFIAHKDAQTKSDGLIEVAVQVLNGRPGGGLVLPSCVVHQEVRFRVYVPDLMLVDHILACR